MTLKGLAFNKLVYFLSLKNEWSF